MSCVYRDIDIIDLFNMYSTSDKLYFATKDIMMHIKHLTLYTANLDAQTRFYTQVLGVEQMSKTEGSVTLKLGNSVLTLVYNSKATPYHFAINIPAHKEHDALVWLKERVGILKHGRTEIQNFDSWNARAIYFYDADKNIVEFISRRNLNREVKEDFSAACLLEISEIGMVVQDIESSFKDINRYMNLPVFAGDFTDFCAIGGEYGLFICITPDRNWFPQNDFPFVSDFRVEVEHKDKTYNLEFKNGRIQYKIG